MKMAIVSLPATINPFMVFVNFNMPP